ncbi:ester cyclase [Lentzea sp. NEAU-D7]|uniref:ester cyclase n=1 Tax=Lentzea sp. NEAU-D7 TaxID=2994667 RepID=UPI00224AF66A|nr:ester cyclase [Lentzea sp. NEAU-D7]MCX2952862.1 ester cyclase [Lentzea sp. NEAU-D7]
MTTPQANAHVARTMYRRFTKNDVEGVVELLAEDYELADMATGESIRGHDGFREWMRRSRSGLPDAVAEVMALHQDGDVVVAEIRNHGTHTGTLTMPDGTVYPATGRRLDVRGCEVLRFRAGRIASCTVYYDALSMADQLGF